MKYLLFTTKPLGKPEISKDNYVASIPCVEGWYVEIKFKTVCVNFGWTDFTEVASITPLPDLP